MFTVNSRPTPHCRNKCKTFQILVIKKEKCLNFFLFYMQNEKFIHQKDAKLNFKHLLFNNIFI